MVSLGELWAYVLLLLAISFPLGYLLVNITKHSAFSRLTLITLPIFSALGLAGYTALLFGLGYLQISSSILWLSAAAIWAIFLTKLLINNPRLRESIRRGSLAKLLKRVKYDTISFVLAGGVPAILLSILLLKGGVTPPPGDPVTHGTHVALLLRQGGFGLTGISLWDTFASIRSYYPKGFHLLGAAVSFMTGLSPPESILVVATAVAVLIPLTVYSIIRKYTSNSWLALMGSLLILVVPSGTFSVSEFVLPAYYVHGLYPFLLGLLLLLAFFWLAYPGGFSLDRGGYLRLLPALAIIGAAVLLSHYLIFVLLLILVSGRIIGFALRSPKGAPVILAAIAVPAAIYFALLNLSRQYAVSFLYLESSTGFSVFWVPIQSFLGSPLSLIVLSALFLVPAIVIYSKRYLEVVIAYSLFAGLVLTSMLAESIYLDYLWFLLPRRSIIPLIIFSVVILMLTVAIAFRTTVREREPISSSRRSRRGIGPYMVGSLILATFVLTANAYVSAGISPWGFPRGDDYEVIQWIVGNVPDQDLILNDRSFIGLYLPSFGIKNVVHLRELVFSQTIGESNPYPKFLFDRIHDSGAVFDDPGNRTLIRELIEKWEIKYVFVSSESVYFDYWLDLQYEWREHNAQEIMAQFDENPDFRPVFVRQTAGVYATFLVFQAQS